jgi:hypothetical protein
VFLSDFYRVVLLILFAGLWTIHRQTRRKNAITV